MATLAQQKAVAIAPKVTAFASILGSATIIFLVSFREGKRNTYHRLMLGMSLCDVLASIAHFCTTWPIPRGTPGVYGAAGNDQRCVFGVCVKSNSSSFFPLVFFSTAELIYYSITHTRYNQLYCPGILHPNDDFIHHSLQRISRNLLRDGNCKKVSSDSLSLFIMIV